MRTMIPAFGLSHEIPSDRQAFKGDGDLVAYGPKKFASCAVEDLPEGLSIMRAPGVGGLHDWADLVMSRHVRQGHPEWDDAVIAGSAARVASWTDGLSEVLSTFVVRGEMGTRFDLWSWYLPSGALSCSVAEFHHRLHLHLASVRWLDSRAFRSAVD